MSITMPLPVQASVPVQTPDKIEHTAQQFEGMFLSTLLATMFSGLETDGPFGGGQSEEMYRSLMTEEYGKAVATNGGIGIADAIKRQMLAYQEIGR